MDPTPRALAEPFRFTPGLTPSAFMDPTSSAFAAFANQPPGLFTPTPATTGMNGTTATVTLPVATDHDLQQPSLRLTLGAPLTLGNSSALPPALAPEPAYGAPQQFQTYSLAGASMHPQYLNPAQYDLRQPNGPGSPMDLSGQEPTGPMGEIGMPTTVPMEEKKFDHLAHLDLLPTSERLDPSHALAFPGRKVYFGMCRLTSLCRFRFSVVLNAPTAMIRHPEEIPVTYLNKGQAYALSIVDTAPVPRDLTTPVRYRTFIRISFHDEAQRSRPAQCWQLWKEGRGTNEAHQRGGKLQAVEYVEAIMSGEDEKRRAKVELESSSFDGFSVIWSPPPGAPAEAAVSVRFNFLSTDFSHSKGVKGIPIRLCAKTQALPSGSPTSATEEPEVCYCKVKLFRDHGAERKLANDILHVRKTIDKLKQQAAQSESGAKFYGKKTKKEEEMTKPGKVPKHRRTWSVSSASSVGGNKDREEDIQQKLQSMQDMFTSTRPVSVLFLRGEEGDDPDVHPVRLPGDGVDGRDQWARRGSVTTTGTNSSFVSPTPSSRSLSSARGDSFSPDKDWEGRYRGSIQHDVPMRVKTNSEEGMLSGWIEAIGIDPNYKPPVEKPKKAIMCVYMQPVVPGQPEGPYYRAVYLEARTSQCLVSSIANKCGIDPATVFRISHQNSKGLSVFVDDDFVNQMNEGQDMKVQVQEITDEQPFGAQSGEWQQQSGQPDGNTKKLELKLLF